MKWIEYKKGWEISERTHNGKTYEEIKKLLKEGEKIADYPLIQKLRNKMIDKRFEDFWVFVPNPDKISKDNEYVAWFVAGSFSAYLGCGWYPHVQDPALGVFLIRRKERWINNT